MNIETNNLHIEKSLFFSTAVSGLIFWKKNKNMGLDFIKNIKDPNFFRYLKNIHTLYIDREQIGLRSFDLYSLGGSNSKYFYHCENCVDLNMSEHGKNLIHYMEVNIKNTFSGKRRMRRKFFTDDERRLARILKNRRTAEESRQRRIQKMKQLENFVITSEERERKLREEIHFLGKQNASQVVELFLIKKKKD